MQLSVKAVAQAGAVLWGGAILLVGLINYANPHYGVNFLQMRSSVYPWFHPDHSIRGIVMGTIDGLVDGAIAGMLFAWLYNTFNRAAHHA